MAHHARAAPDGALLGKTACGAVERREHVRRLHMEAVDVVEAAVVGLGHDRQPPRLQRVLQRVLPLDDRVAHHAHAVGVGDRYRSFEQPAFLHPGRPRHLPVAVQREPGGKDRIGVGLTARVHHGDARAHRALPHDELAAAGDERGVAHFDAGHVGDRVERPRRAADGQLEVALPRLLRVKTCHRRNPQRTKRKPD